MRQGTRRGGERWKGEVARARRFVPLPSSAAPAAAARFPLLRLAADRARLAGSLARPCGLR